MIILVFFLLPFSYFYAEETLTDDTSGGRDPLDTFFDDHYSSDEEEGMQSTKKSKGFRQVIEKISKAIRSTVRYMLRIKFIDDCYCRSCCFDSHKLCVVKDKV
jgi:hypothetical protein